MNFIRYINRYRLKELDGVSQLPEYTHLDSIELVLKADSAHTTEAIVTSNSKRTNALWLPSKGSSFKFIILLTNKHEQVICSCLFVVFTVRSQ